MSDNSKKLFPHALKWGLILSGVLILFSLLWYLLGFTSDNKLLGALVVLLNMAILIFFMSFASIKYRDNYLEGHINFMKCWMVGLIMGILAAILFTLYSYIFNKFLDPSVLQGQLAKQLDELSTREGINEEQIEKISGWMTKMMSPEGSAIMSLIMFISSSFFMSLIATLFVRKKDKITQPTVD